MPDEDKPLLVSIGYSACHWCHVMAHESFEDRADTAALMNDRFVCIKVDREERPDIDALCMEACQALTGHGGWPLNTFLTAGRSSRSTQARTSRQNRARGCRAGGWCCSRSPTRGMRSAAI